MGGNPSVELKNPRFPFYVFWKILIPYSSFSRSDKTDLKELSARVFSNISEMIFVQDFEISKKNISRACFAWFLFFSSNLVSPKTRIIGFGSHGHVH